VSSLFGISALSSASSELSVVRNTSAAYADGSNHEERA
jgi:hypothetical protein